MIFQIVSPNDIPANGPAYDGGSIYAVRVVAFSPGATIAFDNPRSTRKIYGYFPYRNRSPQGWRTIYLTGFVVLEVATDPNEEFMGGGDHGLSGKSYKKTTTATALTGTGALLSLEAPAAEAVRVRRLKLTAVGLGATAAGTNQVYLARTTAAATAGVVLGAPQQDDTADAAFGGVMRSGPTTTPLYGALSGETVLVNALFDSPAIANIPRGHFIHDYIFDGVQSKRIDIPQGVANGVAVYSGGQGAGAVGFLVIELWFSSE